MIYPELGTILKKIYNRYNYNYTLLIRTYTFTIDIVKEHVL